MLAMELSNYLNILEHIRLALEVPDCARDRDVGSYYLELVPTFESTMSFDCEFEQVVHRNLGNAEKEESCRVRPARVYFGNKVPNIGFPLLDCCSVASS